MTSFKQWALVASLGFTCEALGMNAAMDLNHQDMVVFKDLAERSYDDSMALNHMSNNTMRGGQQTLVHQGKKRTFEKTYLYADLERNSPPVGTVYDHPHYCVVALHGSLWLQDWLIDTAKALPELALPASELHPQLSGKIHKAFLKHAKCIYESLQECLQVGPREEIVFTGHSLGGALAILLATHYRLENLGSNKGFIKIVTFSAPVRATGDAAFGHAMNRHLGADNTISFVTPFDLVTQGPWPALGRTVKLDPIKALINPKALRTLLPAPMERLVSILSDPNKAFNNMTAGDFCELVGGSRSIGTSLYNVLQKVVTQGLPVALPLKILKNLVIYVVSSLHALPRDEDLVKSYVGAQSRHQNQNYPAWHDSSRPAWCD